MKTLTKSVLAAIAAGGLLAGCATYDYGYGAPYGYTYGAPYGYTYGAPYAYGYNYNYGYDYGPYYYGYGPSYYVGPSIGFTYHDKDGHYRSDRHYRNDYSGRSHRDSHSGSRSRGGRPAATPPAQSRNDPWGGTNQPFGRNSQQ